MKYDDPWYALRPEELHYLMANINSIRDGKIAELPEEQLVAVAKTLVYCLRRCNQKTPSYPPELWTSSLQRAFVSEVVLNTVYWTEGLKAEWKRVVTILDEQGILHIEIDDFARVPAIEKPLSRKSTFEELKRAVSGLVYESVDDLFRSVPGSEKLDRMMTRAEKLAVILRTGESDLRIACAKLDGLFEQPKSFDECLTLSDCILVANEIHKVGLTPEELALLYDKLCLVPIKSNFFEAFFYEGVVSKEDLIAALRSLKPKALKAA